MEDLSEKNILILICITLLFSIPGISFANEKPNDNEFIYEFEGVTIRGNVPLTIEQIEEMYNAAVSTIKNSKDNNNILDIPDPGDHGRITHGPVYTETDPTILNNTIDVIIAWFSARIPTNLTKHTWFNYLFNKFTGWLHRDPIPIGYWNWRVIGTPYPGCYSDYQTIVWYSDFTYRTPIEMDYYRLDLNCD